MPRNAAMPKAREDDHVVTAMQRCAAFEAEFGNGRHVATAIRTCLIEGYTRFATLDGQDGAEDLFPSLPMLRFPIGAWRGKWSDFLTASAPEVCIQLMVAKAFRELAAYARYGISLNGGAAELDATFEAHVHAGGLQSLAPLSFRGTELEKIQLLSSTRRNLDDLRAVEPRPLAALGDVDENVIATLIGHGELPCVCGRVSAAVALRWLHARLTIFGTRSGGHRSRSAVFRAGRPSRHRPPRRSR